MPAIFVVFNASYSNCLDSMRKKVRKKTKRKKGRVIAYVSVAALVIGLAVAFYGVYDLAKKAGFTEGEEVGYRIGHDSGSMRVVKMAMLNGITPATTMGTGMDTITASSWATKMVMLMASRKGGFTCGLMGTR